LSAFNLFAGVCVYTVDGTNNDYNSV